MLRAQPPVLQADRLFVVVLALILIDLFEAYQMRMFWLLRCPSQAAENNPTSSTQDPRCLAKMFGLN